MSRYATREEEVDKLLRGRVFVDLYRIVRQGLRASVESYSIKKLEPFYGFERDVDLGEATRSLIALEVRLESGRGAGVPDELRAEIEGYNRDDCLSTLRLAEWLESCRAELEARTGEAVPRPALREEEREQERESAAEVAAVFDALVAGPPESEEGLDDEQRARRLLAYLLEFHRREDKSTWWEFFDRCKMGPEELVEHRATLGGLTYTGAVEQIKRSTVHRYRFPEQTHEIEVGDSPEEPGDGRDRRPPARILRNGARPRRSRPHDRPEGAAATRPSPIQTPSCPSTRSTARCCERVCCAWPGRSHPAASHPTVRAGRRSTCCSGCRRVAEQWRPRARSPAKRRWTPCAGSRRGSTAPSCPCRDRPAAARRSRARG